MTDQKQTDGSGLKTLEDLQRTVLIRIVDDDAEVRDALSFMLSCRGWQTAAWGSAEEFLKAWRSTPPGCLLLDIRMPGMSGLELQERMKAQNLSLPIIFVTGHGDVPTAVRTLKLGAFDFLEKPVDAEALADAIEAASRVSVEASQGALPKQAVEQILAEMSPREHEITLLKSLLHAAAERQLVSRESKFQRKKTAFGGISAAIARDGTIRADDAVTRNDDGKRIGAHSTAHRPNSFRRVQLPRNFPIGNRLAVWNFGECVPNMRLKLAANQP